MEYVALDVETANNARGSICSIGLALFVDGTQVDEYYSLVRPPEELGEFSFWCVKVHGITPDIIEHEYTYGEQHGVINSFIGRRLVVAHNAPFDSRHLKAIMEFNGHRYLHQFDCTLGLARKKLVLPDYKLETVCSYLDIELNHHHNALEDAVACGKIYAQLTRE